MQVIIVTNGTSEEIAALALAVRERQLQKTNAPTSSCGGTDNAAAVMNEAARLTEISNAAYASYNNAAYNSDTYNSASYQENIPEAEPAIIEAIPSIAGGGFDGPIKVEVHIHLEGNTTPETVQVLEDYVRRGEIQKEFEEAWERMQADARRRDWF